jgi:hypothetical protein
MPTKAKEIIEKRNELLKNCSLPDLTYSEGEGHKFRLSIKEDGSLRIEEKDNDLSGT